MTRARLPPLPVLAFFAVAASIFTYGMMRLETNVHHGVLLDDAYISLRYARNLAEGHGLVYNVGERVEGYTNFLLTLILSLPYVMGWDAITFAKALGWATGISLLLSTGELVRRLAGPFTAALVVLVMALDLHFVWWCGSGLETMLVSAFYVPALLLLDRRRLVGASLLFVCAALTRMESVLLFGTAFLFLVTRTRGRWRPAARFAGIFAIGFGTYFGWRWSYYGWLFPNTYYAKVGTVSDSWKRGVAYLEHSFDELHLARALLFAGVLFGIVIVATVARRIARRIPTLRPRGGLGFLVATSCAVYGIYVVSVGGDHFQERFVYHFYPLLLGTIAWLCSALVDLTTLSARRYTPLLGGGLFVLLVWPSIGTGPSFGPETGVSGWASAGLYLHEQAKGHPERIVATDAAGIIALESQLPTIDILGLTDEHIAHLHTEVGKGVAGHEKADPDYVLDRNPDYLSTWVDPDGHVCRGFRARWRFWRDYEIDKTVRMDVRTDVSLDRLKAIPPDVTRGDLVRGRVGTPDHPGDYIWGIWKRRTSPVPRRWFGRWDFGTSIPNANDDEDALIHVKAGHPPTHVMWGPFLEFPVGRYALWLDIEVGKSQATLPPDAELCRFDVWDGAVLIDQSLRAAKWEGRNGAVGGVIEVTPDREFHQTHIRFYCHGAVNFLVRRGWLEACVDGQCPPVPSE